MKSDYPTVSQVYRDWRLLFAFGFGSGLSRIMPGTMGTLAAVPVYLLLAETPLWFYVFAVLAATVFGVWVCGYAAKTLGVHDHGGIVWDEFAGYWITMIAVPSSWQWVVAGFVLFRIFDMLKPWPISWLDKHVQGGLGIMLDDVAAGLCSLLCLHLASIWL